MIRHLTLKDVGPARELKFDFSPRLNVLTGDNGLGKTFVLDVLWWVVTFTWAGEKAFPWRASEVPVDRADPSSSRDTAAADSSSTAAEISSLLTAPGREPGSVERIEVEGVFIPRDQSWSRSDSWGSLPEPEPTDWRSPLTAGLVVYARIDSSFAVWDSYYVKAGIETFAQAAISLTSAEVWDGKEAPDAEVQGGKRTVIAGLVADWVNWQQRAKSPEFELLVSVLDALASPEEPLVPGEPTRVHLRDRRDIPTLATSYGVVPVTLASAGVRRALALAYLLVWAWTEHTKAAKLSGRPPTRDVVLLIDEPELHQHPAWQRVFLPAVLRAVGLIAPEASVQVVTATHSPLVLTSLEPHFDVDRDSLFTFDVMPRARRVKVEKSKWRARGDVSNWLTSDVFDLGYARSREAEQALEDAVRVLDQPDLPIEEARRIHRELHDALGDTDPFWARWESYARARGIEP